MVYNIYKGIHNRPRLLVGMKVIRPQARFPFMSPPTPPPLLGSSLSPLMFILPTPSCHGANAPYHGRRCSPAFISIGLSTATAAAFVAVLRNHSPPPLGVLPPAALGPVGVVGVGAPLVAEPGLGVVGNAVRLSGTGRLSVDDWRDSLRAISGVAIVTMGIRGFEVLGDGAVTGRRGRVGGKMSAGVPMAWYDLSDVASSDSWGQLGEAREARCRRRREEMLGWDASTHPRHDLLDALLSPRKIRLVRCNRLRTLRPFAVPLRTTLFGQEVEPRRALGRRNAYTF